MKRTLYLWVFNDQGIIISNACAHTILAIEIRVLSVLVSLERINTVGWSIPVKVFDNLSFEGPKKMWRKQSLVIGTAKRMVDKFYGVQRLP